MKGVASLDTGQDCRVGESFDRASSSSPIVSPQGWHLKGGFTQVNAIGLSGNQPGVKAKIPRRTQKWLKKLQKYDIDADDQMRTERVVDALKDDDAIDDILAMLDDGPPCSFSSNVPTVSAYLLEPNNPSQIHNKIQATTITEAKPIDDRWNCFLKPVKTSLF